MTEDRLIYITDRDMERLRLLISQRRSSDEQELIDLLKELDRARLVSPHDVPANVVTMNSNVRLRNLVTNEEMTFTLVFPEEADIDQGKISVLAPVGTAMLGQQIGDEVEWNVPSGKTRLKVESIFYQPEAAGHFHRLNVSSVLRVLYDMNPRL